MKIAEDACAKQIFDQKAIVFIYAKGHKCGQINDWEENMCYIDNVEYYFSKYSTILFKIY